MSFLVQSRFLFDIDQIISNLIFYISKAAKKCEIFRRGTLTCSTGYFVIFPLNFSHESYFPHILWKQSKEQDVTSLRDLSQ